MTDEEKKAIKEIERELTDEDRKEYMSKWFALDLKILLNFIRLLKYNSKACIDESSILSKLSIIITQLVNCSKSPANCSITVARASSGVRGELFSSRIRKEMAKVL